MRCEEIQSQRFFYLDNELAEEDRVLFERHLETCPACRERVEEDRRFLERVRKSRPAHPAREEFRARLLAQLERAETGRSPRSKASASKGAVVSRRQSRWRWFALAAMILLTVSLTWTAARLPWPQHAPATSSFALMAVETHQRHLRGALPLDLISDEPERIRAWFDDKVRFTLSLPNYPETEGQAKPYRLKGARLIGFNNHDAAFVAYEMGAMPISLLAIRQEDASPSGGERIVSHGLVFHYQAVEGYKVITWSDRGLTYALVSAFEGRGQQSCLVCHAGVDQREWIGDL
jgi:anti-sigma factor RsiW